MRFSRKKWRTRFLKAADWYFFVGFMWVNDLVVAMGGVKLRCEYRKCDHQTPIKLFLFFANPSRTPYVIAVGDCESSNNADFIGSTDCVAFFQNHFAQRITECIEINLESWT